MDAMRKPPAHGNPSLDTLAIARRLLERRETVAARLTRNERALRELGENVEADAAAEAQEETTTALLLRLDDDARREVAAIDAALARLARDEYGICVSCSTTIPRARLDLLPATAQCRECARTTQG